MGAASADADAPRFLRAPNLASVPHGFATRIGGVSSAPFETLNLGLSSGDEAASVEANRDRVLRAFGVDREQVTAFHQVHGARVLDGAPGWFDEEADAAVSATPGAFLVVSVADCFPLLFHDPVAGVVAAAHCGWRGTALGLAGDVVRSMQARHGSHAEDVRVAIGPGIRGACYQVGLEVAEAFRAAGFPSSVCVKEPGDTDRYRLDLPAANRYRLARAGVPDANVHDIGACTHCEPERFYSYRRDGPRSGRHWAVIGLPA